MAASALDAIVIADSPLSRVKVAGLSVRERAIRVARRVGAQRVLVVDDAAVDVEAWRAGSTLPVLMIRADQLVHTPLVAPLVEAMPGHGLVIAVGPDDQYAGAWLATGDAVRGAVAALAARDDAQLIASATSRVRHGEIARHAVATPADRAAAHKLLYRILIKPQDNAITRYLFRPISLPLTRCLVWTPITPNQVSLLVAAIVAFGCWLTAHASMNMAIAGALAILASQYVDCCDGEIARVKLLSSRFGAWIDTIVDELSTVGYMVALGYHCHLVFGPDYFGPLGFDPWLVAAAIGVVTYAMSIYGIYYNIIVAVGSANSQDYVGRFEAVPGQRPNSMRLRPAAATAIAPTRELPGWVQWLATYLPYVVRRDFIAWGTVVLAVLHLTHVSFALQAIGGVVSAVIITTDHIKLRRLRASIVRAGHILESPTG
ncbi:MAG: CDP-alcohol phosphatidyltransferase family protein [Kofleriaceae bacterium]